MNDVIFKASKILEEQKTSVLLEVPQWLEKEKSKSDEILASYLVKHAIVYFTASDLLVSSDNENDFFYRLGMAINAYEMIVNYKDVIDALMIDKSFTKVIYSQINRDFISSFDWIFDSNNDSTNISAKFVFSSQKANMH